MQTDAIAEIGIDSERRLCVRPTTAEFPFIFRAAMQVGWESQGSFLYSPTPKEWSHLQWFEQIIAAAKAEYGCHLVITQSTIWRGVEPEVRRTIIAASSRACV